MPAGDGAEEIVLRGILTVGEWNPRWRARAYILWTYDEEEYLMVFAGRQPQRGPELRLPAEVEVRGKPGVDDKGRKTVTVTHFRTTRRQNR